MNRHILFPVDFSQRSKELIPYIASITRKFNSKVTILHVLGPYEGLPGESELVEVDWPHYQDRLRERRESGLMDFVAGTFDNVNVTAVVDSGEPAERIIHYAAEHDVDLIMMATHGRGTFRKLLLGSVTSKVLHDSAYPVWTTAHTGMLAGLPRRDIQKVVCALDTASDGLRMLEATGDIASVYGAEVAIVHAVPVPTVGFEPGLDNGFGLFLADTAKDLIAKLQRNAGTKWEVS
ncbi:MAG: universal stress protein, partial [Acidobacteriota bacterium]|nr:universal stress protein [Acidobacteriota bacterium]